MTLVDSTLSPLLEARASLAAAIEAATGYPCHDSYTPAVNSPCIILEPAGWQELNAVVDIYRVRVSCLYASKDGADVSNAVEELARLAYAAGRAFGWRAVEVPEPGSISIAGADWAGVQFTFTTPLEGG